MKQHLQQKRKNNAGRKYPCLLVAEKTPLYYTKATTYRSIDDFLRKVPISTVNEYGELSISGKRIC
jgi:hypothetical protein